MKDLLKELSYARQKKIFKNEEFKDFLSDLVKLDNSNKINWDEGAGEEWAFINNKDFSIMINRKIGIFFVRGTIKDPYLNYLKLGNYIVVDSYDLKEWFIDLDELKKNVPEIIWHTSSDDIDTSNFSLDDLYFATV